MNQQYKTELIINFLQITKKHDLNIKVYHINS